MTKSTTKSIKLEDKISQRIANIFIRLAMLIAATIQAVQGQWGFLLGLILLSTAASYIQMVADNIRDVRKRTKTEEPITVAITVVVYVIFSILFFSCLAWAIAEVILKGNWIPWALIITISILIYPFIKEK